MLIDLKKQKNTELEDSVLVASGTLNKTKVTVAIFDFNFMGFNGYGSSEDSYSMQLCKKITSSKFLVHLVEQECKRVFYL